MNIIKPLRTIGEDGNATVEAAVTISLLLLLIIGIIQFGEALYAYNAMLLAVEEAGRYAMVHNRHPPDACPGQNQAARCPTPTNTSLANCAATVAQQLFSRYQGSNIDVSVTEDRTSSPATVTICASYSADFVTLQLFSDGPLILARQVTVPLI